MNRVVSRYWVNRYDLPGRARHRSIRPLDRPSIRLAVVGRLRHRLQRLHRLGLGRAVRLLRTGPQAGGGDTLALGRQQRPLPTGTRRRSSTSSSTGSCRRHQDRRVLTTTGREVAELGAVDTMMQDFLRDYEIQSATAALVKDGRLVLARGYTLGRARGGASRADRSLPHRQHRQERRLGGGPPAHRTRRPGARHHRSVRCSTCNRCPGRRPTRSSTRSPSTTCSPTPAASTPRTTSTASTTWCRSNRREPSTPVKAEIVSYMVGHPFEFAPGSNWDYNNYGYMMLDMMLEQRTGQGFVDTCSTEHLPADRGRRARQAHQLEVELAPTELSYDGLEGDPYRSPMEAGPSGRGPGDGGAGHGTVLFGALRPARRRRPALGRDERVDARAAVPGQSNRRLRARLVHRAVHRSDRGLLGALTDLDDGLDVYGHGGGGSGVHTLALWRGDNTVFVMFSNHDPVAQDLVFPAIDIWPEHDLWQSVGISTEPVGPASTESWIPVVARAEGVGGSAWRSDVGLLNRSTLDNSIRLRHYQDGAYTDLELMLAAGAQSTPRRRRRSARFKGAGPLRVFSSEPLTVTSRTFNQTGDGTFGQFLPGMAPDGSHSTGDEVVLMQLQENATIRTNIGLTNGWKRAARVAISLFDGAGEPGGDHRAYGPARANGAVESAVFCRGGPDRHQFRIRSRYRAVGREPLRLRIGHRQ